MSYVFQATKIDTMQHYAMRAAEKYLNPTVRVTRRRNVSICMLGRTPN